MPMQTFLHHLVSARAFTLSLFFLILFLRYYKKEKLFAAQLFMASFIMSLFSHAFHYYLQQLDYMSERDTYELISRFTNYSNFFEYICLSIATLLLLMHYAPQLFKTDFSRSKRLWLLIIFSILSLGFLPIVWLIYKYTQQKEKDRSAPALILTYIFAYSIYYVNYFIFMGNQFGLNSYPTLSLVLDIGPMILSGVLFLILVFRIKNRMEFMEHDLNSDYMALLFTIFYLDYKEQTLLQQLPESPQEEQKATE